MMTIRCAIYTRKSSDEGLEQSFNSLDAQREACSAYILSQASEGWSEIHDVYDDGGISGGTLERPALKRLMEDIGTGRIDIVVVYKVDRLTRSLFDFAKLVEHFDKAGTSFVSITQSFNTTSSMGRLTLNMLLSFAQFEREVTAERIRDKIAASKAKGMWMGGVPPIGYRPNGRSLAVVEEHAALVRQIFELYLEVGTVPRLELELNRRRIHAPDRVTSTGRTIGGRPLSRGQLEAMLRSRIFLGEIDYKGQVYRGLHPPIVPRTLWDAVQDRRAANLQGIRTAYQRRPHLLAGLIVDANGEALIAAHSCKAGAQGTVRYRYYVSRALQQAATKDGMRIPAKEIEGLVTEQVAQLFDDALTLVSKAELDLPPDQLGHFDKRCVELAAVIRQKQPDATVPLIARVTVGESEVVISLSTLAIAQALGVKCLDGAPQHVECAVPVRVRRSGMAMKLLRDGGAASVAAQDHRLVRLIVQARRWWAELKKGEINVSTLAARHGCTPSYLTRVLRLAFLSPVVIDAVLRGRQRASVNVDALTHKFEFLADWKEQERALVGC